MPTHTRATSIYTLHLPSPAVADAANTYGLVIQDRGESSISWREPNADAALLTARDIMAGLSDGWQLTTGLGVHRRTVHTETAS